MTAKGACPAPDSNYLSVNTTLVTVQQVSIIEWFSVTAQPTFKTLEI